MNRYNLHNQKPFGVLIIYKRIDASQGHISFNIYTGTFLALHHIIVWLLKEIATKN